MDTGRISRSTLVGHLYYIDPDTHERVVKLTLRDTEEQNITGDESIIEIIKDKAIKIPPSQRRGFGNLSEVRFQKGQRRLFIEAFLFYFVDDSHLDLKTWTWNVVLEKQKVEEEEKSL